mmetsp:Transcript_55450/g.166265  ORF Transcript_55450/g.166265 Transcript_55450/m.166265 type:complete len:233 (-) Transcript_55450:325-1023(-)
MDSSRLLLPRGGGPRQRHGVPTRENAAPPRHQAGEHIAARGRGVGKFYGEAHGLWRGDHHSEPRGGRAHGRNRDVPLDGAGGHTPRVLLLQGRRLLVRARRLAAHYPRGALLQPFPDRGRRTRRVGVGSPSLPPGRTPVRRGVHRTLLERKSRREAVVRRDQERAPRFEEGADGGRARLDRDCVRASRVRGSGPRSRRGPRCPWSEPPEVAAQIKIVARGGEAPFGIGVLGQ